MIWYGNECSSVSAWDVAAVCNGGRIIPVGVLGKAPPRDIIGAFGYPHSAFLVRFYCVTGFVLRLSPLLMCFLFMNSLSQLLKLSSSPDATIFEPSLVSFGYYSPTLIYDTIYWPILASLPLAMVHKVDTLASILTWWLLPHSSRTYVLAYHIRKKSTRAART